MIDASIKNSFRDKRKKCQISLHLTFKAREDFTSRLRALFCAENSVYRCFSFSEIHICLTSHRQLRKNKLKMVEKAGVQEKMERTPTCTSRSFSALTCALCSHSQLSLTALNSTTPRKACEGSIIHTMFLIGCY